ncbi:hypothetical protein SK803_40815 [Lentzea sp. BCCO 10_0856]|uniref:Uncharacterized protein n=1 Tax=Lentzea miocenica TaxID=3095431 RepID=A0ABU4TEE7_9PSEU|nr:hypothetical protein [Lentzea sp. BCCO 10_0856]MDX8036574.1 hypothetical protein [Lentzea sp. BCCO 10_0856]
MASPFAPGDDNREVVPDEAILYRRVDWDKIGGKKGCAQGEEAEINGNCFSDYPEAKAIELGYPGACMSVGLGLVLLQKDKKPVDLLDGFDGYGLIRVKAGDLRNLRKLDGSPCPQGIKFSPTGAEPWHCVVFDLSGKRTSAAKKAIAKVASWEVPLIG